jgi:hypothetical protein
MKQKVIGNFCLGCYSVEVVLREGWGAEYYTCPETAKPPRIKVGAAGHWNSVVSRLLHEALELSMDTHKLKFRRTQDLSDATDCVDFFMSHQQFSMVCSDVGTFISEALPALSKEWNKAKWRKP